MAIIKCKMCGGDIVLAEERTHGTCEYCGSTMTFPKVSDEQRLNLFNRANHFRRQNDFDKAIAAYDKILDQDDTDAEAHWGAVLSRYGIEYVEDPVTHERIPTCHRVQLGSILTDADYLAALKYARDAASRDLYEQEAKRIAEIQKGILAISSQEKPFDVFICYKETDANGRRTPDSVLANDMYHQLTKEGFKVFFSRITLEDKIGTAYEPYIFAALNSAKVMVVLGTKPEYFNAVWVKNEWSRYLALIRAGADKTLVPAYRDMDPYDLPEEFAHLQAQDMGKLGYMQDLIHGIKKILRKDEPKPQTVVQQVVTGSSVNIDNLTKRARLFMEDGDWNAAEEYLNKVLDENAEYAPAYVGRVQAAMHLNKEAELAYCQTVYEDSPDWRKALRFATPEQRRVYESYVAEAMQAREEKRKSEIYAKAIKALKRAKTPEACDRAKAVFALISGYKDTDAKKGECDEKREAFERKIALIAEAKNKIIVLVEKAAIVSEVNGAQIHTLQNTDDAMKALEKALTTITQRYEQTKAEMSDTEKKLQNLHGWFIGKQRRVLETAISQMSEKRKSYESKLAELQGLYYRCAEVYLDAEQYDLACRVLIQILDYKDAERRFIDALSKLQGSNKRLEALLMLRKYSKMSMDKCIGALSKLKHKIALYATQIGCGYYHTVGLKSDGTVVAVGSNEYGRCDVDSWSNIVTIAAVNFHTVGLKSDGTVVAVGDNKHHQCDVGGWSDIVAIAAGNGYTIGLKSDGTVAAVGSNSYNGPHVKTASQVTKVKLGRMSSRQSNRQSCTLRRNPYYRLCLVPEPRDPFG